MKSKRFILLSLTLLLFFTLFYFTNYRNIEVTPTSATQNQLKTEKKPHVQKQLTTSEKLDDFHYLYNILKENYPYFEVNKRLNSVDWLSNKSKYEDSIKKTTTDEKFRDELNYILLDLHNGHTNIFYEDFYNDCYDVYKEIKDDGYTEWFNVFDNALVKKRYNKTSHSEIKDDNTNNTVSNVAQLKTDIIKKNKIAYLQVQSFNLLTIEDGFVKIKSFLETVKNYPTLIIDIRGNGGGSDSYYTEGIVPLLISKDLSENVYTLFRGGDYCERFFKAKNCSYKDLTPILKLKNYNLKNLPQETYSNFKYFKCHTITIKPKNPVGFSGKIFLLVDSKVYSSAEAFAVFCKSTGFAKVVGEKTAGDGIGYDPIVMALPKSGYVVRFTGEMGLDYSGQCNEEMKTTPDVLVDATIGATYAEDKAIQKVMEMVNEK